LSGSEPRHDEHPEGEATAPPGLVFKPDVQQTVRVARVRTYTLLATAILMVVALVLILSYRPPPVVLSDQEATRSPFPAAQSESSLYQPAPSRPSARPGSAGPASIARSTAAAVDTLLSAAAEKWVRAAELVPGDVVTRENAQAAIEGLRKAAVLADSARRDIMLARQRADLVRRASREAGSGSAFRLGVLYATTERYLKALDEDAADRRSFYEKSELSVKAVMLDDMAESEIQQNVATRYLRHSEEMQPSIRRLAEQMREAMRNFENVRR